MNKTYQVIWRFSGVASVIVLWTATIISMKRAGLGLIDTRPLSYLGVNPSTARIFSIGLLLSAAAYICFALYVYKYFHPGRKFLMYFLGGQAGQITAALVPYGDNSRYRLIHTIAAFALAFSLPLLIRAFARSQTGAVHHHLFKRLFYFELMLFVVGMGIFTQTHGIAPLGEALPAIGFHVWIGFITVLPPRINSAQKKIKGE